MTVYRVVVAGEIASQERGTTIQNVFHVQRKEGAPSIDLTNLFDAVEDIYNEAPSGGGAALGTFLSNRWSRILPTRILAYDLDDAEPRPPIGERLFTLVAPATILNYPAEVALFVTARAELVPGADRRRLRGGTYFGPLNQQGAPTNGDRPGVTLQAAAGGAMADFLAASSGGLITWRPIVYSAGARDNSVSTGKPWEPGYVHPRNRPLLPPLESPIVHYEVDDDFDTMRKRSIAAATRTVYGS